MIVRTHGLILAAATLLATASVNFTCDTAQALGHGQPQYDLFYNYYVGGGAGGPVTPMYPAPLTSVPSFVGHTNITYQPLLPHEFLYKHKRHYSRHTPGHILPTTTAKVRWR